VKFKKQQAQKEERNILIKLNTKKLDEKSFEVKYFFISDWYVKNSFESRFQELHAFNCIFEFLLSLITFKSLNVSRLLNCCFKFAKMLSLYGSSHVELNDII
jgi:hypothetical protein